MPFFIWFLKAFARMGDALCSFKKVASSAVFCTGQVPASVKVACLFCAQLVEELLYQTKQCLTAKRFEACEVSCLLAQLQLLTEPAVGTQDRVVWLCLMPFCLAPCARRHHLYGTVIARSAQPEVGWLGWRSPQDENLIQVMADACSIHPGPAIGNGLESLPDDPRLDSDASDVSLVNGNAFTSSEWADLQGWVGSLLRQAILTGGQCWGGGAIRCLGTRALL